MSIYPDALPELQPYEVRELVRDGHVLHIRATGHTGINTGRRRYSVECLTCREEVHPATTGPMQNVELHLREAKRSAV